MYISYYKDYLGRKYKQYGVKFDTTDLCEKFIPYFESGQRIEVLTPYGDTLRGYVGVTAGQKPMFLLVARSNSTGSSELLDERYTIVKALPRYR